MQTLKRLKNLLSNEKIEYVFFDFFDTLVHRNLDKAQINYSVAQAICRKYGISDQYAQDVYRMRVQAERFAECEYGAAYEYRHVTDELWRRMLYTNLITADVSASLFYTSLSDLEQQEEQKHLIADQSMMAVLEYLSGQNIKIAIISDYYLGKQTLQSYLTHLNISYPFIDVFVSCDCHATKQAGDLYEYVKHVLGAVGEQCVMIGDNLISDVQQARSKDMHALHVQWRNTCKEFVLPQAADAVKAESLPDMPKGMMAYAIALYTFCDKLYTELKKDGHTHVWFLSREGQALKSFFDLYQKSKCINDMQTGYLYVSRLATYLPSLQPATKETFSLMHGRSLDSLLTNLQFEPHVAKQILSQFAQDFVIDADSVQELWKNELFTQAYTHRYEQQSQAILTYFKQQGLYDCSGRIAICDVGWSGTMQDHIQRVLGDNVTVYGYYLGMTGRTLRSAHAGRNKKGLLFDAYALDCKLNGHWSFDHTFFERLLSADHPAVAGYAFQDDVAIPVLKEYESESGMYALVSGVQKQLEVPFARLCSTFETGQTYSCESALAQSYLQGIAKLNRKDLMLQRELLLRQYENFMIMKSGREYSGKRLTLRYAWSQRAKYLDLTILSDPRRLMIAGRVLTNAKLYGFAKIARSRAAKLVKKGRS